MEVDKAMERRLDSNDSREVEETRRHDHDPRPPCFGSIDLGRVTLSLYPPHTHDGLFYYIFLGSACGALPWLMGLASSVIVAIAAILRFLHSMALSAVSGLALMKLFVLVAVVTIPLNSGTPCVP